MKAEKKPRAVLYLRQSTYREESISLDLQEIAGRDYCKQQGYRVIAVEADPGISGRTWNRPAVQRVMSMVEDKKADVIVLWKWSRLSRSRRDWALAVDKVELAGGRIESATEPLDVATSTGRLARGLMVEFAAFESERIGDVWREAHQRRIRAGKPANGKARWGYLYNKEEQLHYPDPQVAPIVKETFERYIAGESIYSLVRWLNEKGVTTAPGYGRSDSLRQWSDRILRRTLSNGFQAGFFTANGELHEGVHEPIIDRATWELFNERMKSRSTPGQKPRSQYLLSGLLRCAKCGHTMTAGQFGRDGSVKYRCKGASDYRLHDGSYIMAPYVERLVLEWLEERSIENEPLQVQPDVSSEIKTKVAELSAINARLLKLSQDLVSDLMPTDIYQVLISEATSERQRLETELQSIRVASRRPEASKLASDLMADWDILPVWGRREILKDLIQEIRVTTGRPRGIVEIVPKSVPW